MTALRDLLSSISVEQVAGDVGIDVSGIACDSRRAASGNLFICIKGFNLDGHAFIPDALKRGVTALLVQDANAMRAYANSVPVARVRDTRKALADVACSYYGHPSRKLCLVGVTGTNGKTTTAHIVASVLSGPGVRSATIGTLGAAIIALTANEALTANDDAGNYVDTQRTTPESLDLQRMLAHFADRGVSAVAMEVSSHALMLERVRGCVFDVGVFTNFSQDHLDFHESLEEYYRAKERLFREFAVESSRAKQYRAVINLDDRMGQRYIDACPAESLTYGVESDADIRADEIDIQPSGASYVVRYRDGARIPVRMKITGRFNVYNALAALATGEALGVDRDVCRHAVANVRYLPGRLEMIEEGQPFAVCVDYAHTSDGIEKVLSAAREIASGRLIILFGCGGDRDAGKRPKMARSAAQLSDFVVVTSDNPRSEDPDFIIEQIVRGLPPHCDHVVEPDRRRAIELAMGMAKPGDCVVLAGKGHETYQILKDRTIHFDDREVAREALRGGN